MSNQYDMQEVEFDDLREEFEEIAGFLVTAKMKDIDGGKGFATKFSGVVKRAVEYTDERQKKRHFFIVESLSDQKCEMYNEETDTKAVVKKGDMVGLSDSAATKGLVSKIGHYVTLEYTGKLTETRNGRMLEVNGKISRDPVPCTVTREKKKPAQAAPAGKSPTHPPSSAA